MDLFLKRRIVLLILLLSTLLIATFLRWWNLTEFPPCVAGDEAQNGLDALRLIAAPKLTVFLPANTGREALFYYFLMSSIAILGPTAFALRIWPTIVGILVVALSYRWVRSLLSGSGRTIWIALLAAVFMATSLWGLYMSRMGLRAIFLLPFMLATYHFFWTGYSRSESRWFVLSGLFLGLSTYTYLSSRLIPLTLVLFVGCLSIFYRKRETNRLRLAWSGLVITALVSGVVFVPLGWYFFNHPDAFLLRSSQVSLWESYQVNHAHTGESFTHFVLTSWGDNLRWFVNLSTPWIQNQGLPVILYLLPFFFWIGLIRAAYLARRHPGYTFLLISFFVGILPILFSPPTLLRVILAFPATYALLAIGVYYPLEYLSGKIKKLDLPIHVAVIAGVLLIATISSSGFFRFGRWVGLPPLPTFYDHAFDVAAKRIRSLVLTDRQSVLVPQAVYGFSAAYFLLQDDFASPLPVQDKTLLAPTETLSIFWPVDWARWFENKPPSFVLLSPGVKGDIGYVEKIGQWEQAKVVDFEHLVQAQQSLPETEVVLDGTGQPIGHILKVNRNQVIDKLREVPQNPVQFNFQNQIRLLGYDTWFLSPRDLDIGLFWQAQQYLEEDHHLVLQVVDRDGQIQGETVGVFRPSTAAWSPGQLIIDHQIIKLTDSLPQGIYILRIGLIKFNYTRQASLGQGEWLSASNLAGGVLPELLIPIGLIQVGDSPGFDRTLSINFDDKISLTGYRLDQGASPNTFQISLRWQALKPIEKDYTITIQLLDQTQNLIAQVDKPPLGGAYPTTAWSPGNQIPDIYDLQLPPGIPRGVYQLVVGVYDLQTLQRLPVSQTDNSIPKINLVILQQIVLN
jgi:hypothetical protein